MISEEALDLLEKIVEMNLENRRRLEALERRLYGDQLNAPEEEED